MNSKLRKYLTIAALGLAGGTIYFLPYIKYVFYDAQIAAMDINNTQSGMLLTMYTIGNVILYIPGGLLADKIAPKKAISISLFATAVLCFTYAFTFSYGVALVIWVGLSFSTAFVFWSSLMKAVRIVGTEEEQGFMYGLYYACNGLTGALATSVALYAYGTTSDITQGFFRAVMVGGAFLIIAAILILLLLKADSGAAADEEAKFKLKDVGTLVKNPIVWIFSITIFCAYGIFACTSYFNPYLTDVVGVSAVESGVFTIIRNYVFLLLAPLGGLLADKVFKSTAKWLTCAMLILAGLFIGVLLMPSGVSPFAASVYTLIPGAVAMMMYGVVFSIVSEAGISRTMTGTAIGIASIIGYLPDSIYHTMFGNWLDKYGGQQGYTTIFGFLAASGVVGAALAFTIFKKNKAAKKAA